MGWIEKYPKQTACVGASCEVLFNSEQEVPFKGVVVRDDDDDCEPHVMIIRLDDQRYVLSTECMYSLKPREEKT